MADDTAYDVGAIIAYLLGDARVAALVDTRVFGESLPEREAMHMPRKCVLVRSTGTGWLSMAGRSEVPIDNRTKDVRCYGETPYEAQRVYEACYFAFKALRRQLVSPLGGLGQVMMYSALKIGGPTALREPETEWPLAFGTYNFMVADAVA